MKYVLKVKALLLIFLFIFSCQITYSQKVKASVFGIDQNDDTQCLLKAFKSDVDTIIVDNINRPWLVRPLRIENLTNKTIIFEKGVVLRAVPGAFKNSTDELFRFSNAFNIKLIGNNTLITMNKEEYIDGEWRHALSFRKCNNILLKDFVLENSGGDGIYISGIEDGSYSKNLQIENVICRNNKRQGISIISAENVLVKNCIFTETKGTLPESGVDIEPNDPSDRIINITFKDCSFTNNHHAGIKLSLEKLNSSSLPISVLFQNCYLSNNHDISNSYSPAEISIMANKNDPVKGNVFFTECLIENSDWGILYSRKRNDAFHVTFNNSAARNICRRGTTSPISLEVQDYYYSKGSLGGFTFTNLFIQYNTAIPPVEVRGSRLGTLEFKDVNGKIVIKNRNIKSNKLIKYINYDQVFNKNVNLDILHFIK